MLRSRISQFSKAGSQRWQQIAATSGAVTALRRSPVLATSSQRHFSSETSYLDRLLARFQSERLRGSAMTSEKAAFEYLQALVVGKPAEAKIFIERAWESGRLPFNDSYVRLYLSAVGNMGKLQSLNVAALLGMYQKHLGLDAASANAQLTAALRQASNTTSGTSVSLGAVAGPAFAAQQGTAGLLEAIGSSPKNPVFVTMNSENVWRAQMSKIVTYSVCALITYILFMSFVDEKLGGVGGQPGAPGAGGIGGGGGAGGMNPFSRFGSGSAVHPVEKSDKTFEDVVGIDEAKQDLQEIVLYLKDPKRFTRLGGKLPKGVLLTGPPGTGKTLLARAIAGEAEVPFFHASGSEFEEMFVGVGAKRVRELFEVAKAKAPCIIFIDEIDAIGGSRHLKDQSAMKMTLNQLLVEMDGFQQNNGVIVIAATNFPDSLDSALVRPGRFDKHVEVSMPDIGGRKAILQFYSKKIPLDSDVDLDQIARATPGFSGAELFNLMNTAALRASVDNLLSVNMHALEHAKDKILMGAERKSAIISPETLRMTAYHEAGHALVALKSDGADPIHKATIMPRGRALGMVMQLPDGDQTSMSRKQMLARLDVCMGGRVAEELVYGALQVTSGAMGDLQQATRLARAMVMKYGLSDSLGMRFIDETEQKFLSPVLQQEIDQEVKALLESSYQRAKLILEKNRKELELIAQGLLEYESLSGGEIVDLLAGKKLKTGVKRSQRASRQSKELTAIHQAIGPNNATTSSGNTNTNINHSNANGKPTETTSAATTSNINNTNNNNTNNNSNNNNNNNANAASNTSTSNSNTTNNSSNSSSSKIAVRGPPGKAASSS